MSKKKNVNAAVYHCDDIVTHVPACCLVEDYQNLCRAMAENDWDLVQVTAECIAEAIDRYTAVADKWDKLKIKPSGSSIINMSFESGILTQPDGSDLLCANGKPVSAAMSEGCCQCDNLNCEFFRLGKCDPEAATLLLAGGFKYHGADSYYSEELDEYLQNVPTSVTSQEETA